MERQSKIWVGKDRGGGNVSLSGRKQGTKIARPYQASKMVPNLIRIKLGPREGLQ